MNRKAFLTMVAAAAGAAMDEEIGNKPDLVVLPEICDVLQGVSPQEKADWLRRRGHKGGGGQP